MTDSTRDERAADALNLQPGDALPSQLSAFMDDELPGAETDLFVRHLVRDAELKQAMSRYLLIGEALRQPTYKAAVSRVSRDFSARVAAALESDVAKAKTAVPQKARISGAIWKNAVGLAVAASVAVAALVLVRQPETGSTAITTAKASNQSTGNSYIVPVSATGPAAPIPAARLTNYVVAHSEFSSPLGRQNLMTGLLSEDRQTETQTEEQTEVTQARAGKQAAGR